MFIDRAVSVWISRVFVTTLFLSSFPLSSAMAVAGCNTRAFSYSEEQVLTAYIAYYGRPPDTAGLDYWANRLADARGDLSEIIHAFGYSEEFDNNYGHLNNSELVTGLYWQLLGRAPDPAGLNWYVGGLNGGGMTLQTVALDIIYGVQNEDVATVENRLVVAEHFITALQSWGLTWDDIGWSLLDEVTSSTSTRDAACSVVTSSTWLGLFCSNDCDGSFCQSWSSNSPCVESDLRSPCLGTSTGMYCSKSCSNDADCANQNRDMKCLTSCPNYPDVAGKCWSVSDHAFMTNLICP